MALIPVYHVVPSYYDVDPTTLAAIGTTPIKMGMFIGLDATSGGAIIADGTNSAKKAIGIAGDSAGTTNDYTPYAADLVISGSGATRRTQNRISDYFNHTAGSNKLTVYHSGGEFLTDQYTGAGFTPGCIVYCNSGGLAASSGTQKAGRCVSAPAAYPSGVPGTDVAGSISLGTYLRFHLNCSLES